MADTPKPREEGQQALDAALDNPDIPKLYANAFAVGLTNADMFIIFQKFGQRPAAVVNLSYTLAKTLAQRLGALVAEFEAKVAEQSILTTDRIDEAMKRAAQKVKSDDVH
jgi:hypothetical protein